MKQPWLTKLELQILEALWGRGAAAALRQNRAAVSVAINIHLESDLDELTTAGVTVFRAVEEQLGLKLVSIKGPRQVVVIDHIERPAAGAPPTPFAARR